MTTAKPFVLSNQILDIWLWSVSLLLTIIKFIIQNYYDFPCMKYLIIHTQTQTDTNTYTNTVILLCSSEFFWQETKRKYLLELLVMLLLLTFPFWRSNYPKQNGNRFKSFFFSYNEDVYREKAQFWTSFLHGKHVNLLTCRIFTCIWTWFACFSFSFLSLSAPSIYFSCFIF